MPLGDRALNDIITSEHQAGRSAVFAARVLWDICRAMDHLHVERSLIHADVKPKNICRFDTVHKMIDMDGAAREGEAQAGRKPSPAYTPPESAKQLFLHDCGDYTGVAREAAAIVAHPSFDSWSIGVVAQELLSGFKLFPTDQADDRVIDRHSLLELVNWRTIDDLRLQQILPGCADEDVRAAAQDFVAGCLQGGPAKRLTMQQLLGHPFIQMHRAQLPDQEPAEPEPQRLIGLEPEPEVGPEQEVDPEPEPEVDPALELVERLLDSEPEPEPEISKLAAEPEVELKVGLERKPETTALPGLPLPQLSIVATTWHFFLSHMQTEARDLVKDLFSMMRENGCRAWLDMQAEKINLPGMRAGVRGSDCLLLVLTKGVLFRPFCVAEVYEAIKAEKRIVLVSEEDPRSPVRWDFVEWQTHWDTSGVVEVEAEVAEKQRELYNAY
jgi:serine/threonine protein kinase